MIIWPDDFVSRLTGVPGTANPSTCEHLIESLRPRLAFVLLRHYRDGLSYSAIGKEMRISGSRVYSLAENGLRFLRKMIATEDLEFSLLEKGAHND